MGYGKGTTAPFFCPSGPELKVISLPFLHLFRKANICFTTHIKHKRAPGFSPLIGNLLALRTD